MILILLLSSADFFFKINFFKSIFQEHYHCVKRSVSRSGRAVGTDLGTNCLQRLSADNKSRRGQEKSEKTKEIMKVKATKYK